METIKTILNKETKGLIINNKTRNKLCFSYDDAEGMLNRLAESIFNIIGSTWELADKEQYKRLKEKTLK